jgi:hypothetical protein
MILASNPIRSGHNRPVIKLCPLFALLLLTLVPSYGQKPTEWDSAVQSAASSPPTFWLNSDPSSNMGDIQFDRLLRYVGGEWARFEDGPWGEAQAGFGLPLDAENGVVVMNSKQTDIACSDEGSVAVLFRAPSGFNQNEPHLVFARGMYGAASPFELSINKGQLRLAYAEGGAVKTANLARVEEGVWAWVALTWQKTGETSEIAWRVWTRTDGLSQGALSADQVGSSEFPLILAGRTVRCTLADGILSQVIVWNTPIGEDGWNKLEALLPNN